MPDINLCQGYYDITQTSMSFDDVAIVTVGRNDYGIHFWSITKSQM